MRYKDRDKLVASLREAADFFEDRGVELPIDDYDMNVKLNVFLYDDDERGSAKEQLRKVAKVLGKAEKDYSGSYFDLTKKFGVFELEFSANRESVCERRVVRTETTPGRVEVIPPRTREIIEWDCSDPLLKG